MLFSRRKNTASIEGTQGKYVKRESPPPVPSLSATNVSRTRRLPSTASSIAIEHDDAQPSSSPIMETFEEIPVDLNNSDVEDLNDCEGIEPIFEGKESTVFDRLHSRSTVSENDVYSESNDEPTTSFGMRNNNVLSSRSFNRGALKYIPRKSLTTSHSIGNVEQGLRELSVRDGELTTPQQPKCQSLQTLPSEQIMTIQQYRTSCGDLGGSDELPLPEHWAIEYTSENQKYYSDHKNRRTHWVHPLMHESLKPGWKKFFDSEQGVFYYNEHTKQTQFEHPGIANSIFRTESVNVANRSTIDLNANLHIIEEKELPPWLLMYAQSDSSLDHLLEWDLFDLDQLTEYEHVMRKLYKQEVIDIVRKYEKMRNVLNREIHRRDVSRPPPPRH